MGDSKNETIRFVISRYDAYFNLANVKASLLVTTNGVLLGVAITAFISLYEKSSHLEWITQIKVLLSLSVLFILLSSYNSLKVIFSYLKTGNRCADYHSFIFFGSVREIERNTYVEKFGSLSDQELLNDLIEQAHILAVGLSKKYLNLNYSTIYTGISVLLICIVGLVLYWS